jgi:hypothetical protein
MNIVGRVKSLNRNVVEAFLCGEDARNRLGSLVSKEYEGVRILQHYETIEAVYYRAPVRSIECWSRGFSTCPSFADYSEYFKKASLPITGLAGVLKLPLSAIAEAVPANPDTEIPCLLWVKVDGRTYGYETYWESRPANIIVDLDGQAAYMYSIWKRPSHGKDVALDPPVFRVEYVRRLPLTYIYERVRRRYNLRRRYLSRILHLPDLRALRHIGRVEVEIGNGLPSITVVNNAIYIYASKITVFRVEVLHDFFGRRGTVAKVVALDNWPILPLSSYIDYLNREDDEEYPLPSVAGVWLVGRDVTGQLWVTEFDRCFYSYPAWTLDRLAMGLRPDDRIVDES